MIQFIKGIIKKVLPNSWVKQLLNFKRLAVNYGQFYTIKNMTCVDRNRNEIPWYTYPAIEYLNNIDFSKKILLEYGSGNSTKYWSKKVHHVVSIEHDKRWFEKVNKSLEKNATLILKETSKEYVEAIDSLTSKFDVIVIDGILRVECSQVIGNHLNVDSTSGYMVILDNSDWYKNTSKYLREKLGMIEIDFHGFTPINSYTSTTSVFLSRNFDFKPTNNIQPNYSIAALEDCFD